MADKTELIRKATLRTLEWRQLKKKEQKDFDYLDTYEKQCQAVFVRYRKVVYDLDDFMRIRPSIAPHPQRPEWEKYDGYRGDSFFSGVLMKVVEDECGYPAKVRMATYYC